MCEIKQLKYFVGIAKFLEDVEKEDDKADEDVWSSYFADFWWTFEEDGKAVDTHKKLNAWNKNVLEKIDLCQEDGLGYL